MANERGLGWLPDVPKTSDYGPEHQEIAPLLKQTKGAARTIQAGAPSAPSAQIDLRQWFSPIEDQGGLGSCTANAAVGLVEYFERRAKGTFLDASRLFVYKTERDLLGWTGDTGAYLRTAMEALALFGAPPERYWPYDGRPAATNTRFEAEPSAFCYAFGENYKALKYFRLDSNGSSPTQALTSIKLFAAAGFPSMFGFPVYSEYDNPLPGGLVAYPVAGSHYRGGHANVVAGYDDNLMIGADKGALLIRNSWGNGWANGGYAWMSYKYVTHGLATDWWSMISANWVATGQF
jgi:C1A family cysteine protease